MVDGLDFEIQRRPGTGGQLHFYDEVVAGEDGRPQLGMFFIVGRGKGTNDFFAFGLIQDQAAAGRHGIGRKTEVERVGTR